MISNEKPGDEHTVVEHIKYTSNFLRGGIVEGLEDRVTGAIFTPDTQLSKFHGMYQQDDRDLRLERQKQKLEPLYSFMIRVRIPGGVCSPAQYLVLDNIAQEHANGTLRLTTRQTFQFHGVLKGSLRPALQDMHTQLLDCIAACGDVNRNVMCNPNPDQSAIHAEVLETARSISTHLLPRTHAYHDIWLNGEKVLSSEPKEEPIYGKRYLPRKFKIAIAVPPSNDVDIYANDLGYIAIVEDGKLVGYNVTAGGGMGSTHGDVKTYPRTASMLGFCSVDDAVAVAEAVVTTQRDFGDRTDRKHARLKYTIDDRGLEWFVGEVNSRLATPLQPAREFRFEHNGDRYGWVRCENGKWHCTLFVMNGRIKDTDDLPLMTGLREIARVHKGDFRMSANQNIIIGDVAEEQKPVIEKLLEQFGLSDTHVKSALRLNAMACVGFPTCGLSMAESERYLPDLISLLEPTLKEAGLENDPITIRMTGCPNGCARPFIAEIAMVGKAPGKYNLYLGGGFHGQRLNKLYKENIGEEEILSSLRPLLLRYARERKPGERLGDFLIRVGEIKETREGLDFHDQ